MVLAAGVTLGLLALDLCHLAGVVADPSEGVEDGLVLTAFPGCGAGAAVVDHAEPDALYAAHPGDGGRRARRGHQWAVWRRQ